METLIEGAVLAIVVVLIFLRDWRATLIAAIALPLSIIPTFWAMEAMGFSLNLVSLLAITLVTGILVDDAIVEIENIVRHMRMGKSPYRAALEAADEIGLAVIAITMTIVAVFAPVSFMGGIAGQYFKQFGLDGRGRRVLLAAGGAPDHAAAGRLFHARARHGASREGADPARLYAARLAGPCATASRPSRSASLIFAGSISKRLFLPDGFLPAEDSGRALLGVELPPGSRLADTEAVTEKISRRISARPDVRSAFVIGGTLLGGGDEVRKATLIVNLVAEGRAQALAEARSSRTSAATWPSIPDIRFWLHAGQRPAATSQLVVSGPRQCRRVQGRGRADQRGEAPFRCCLNVVSTAELDRPELRIMPNSEQAAELGVTTEAISETVRIATLGDVDANLAKFDVGDRQVPIRVQLDETARDNRQLIEELKVTTASGAAGAAVGRRRLRVRPGPDRHRPLRPHAPRHCSTPISSARRRSAMRSTAVMRLPAAKTLPPGVEIQQFGDAEIMGEVFQSFAHGHGRRPDDGLRRAGAAVLQLPAADHHPVLAAALHRRRDRRAAAHATSRSVCRSSSAS